MRLAPCSEALSSGRVVGLPSRRCFLARCGLGLAGLPLAVRQVRAAGRTQPPLIQYLVRLGYHAFELKRDRHDHFLVAGELEEQRVTFLVDTGCSVSAVDRRLLKGARTLGELGIAIQDSLLGRIDQESIYLGKRLALGKAEFFNQPLQPVDTASLRQQWNAILGLDFLLRHHAILDCWTGWLCLRDAPLEAGLEEALDASLQRSGYLAVPLTPADGLTLLCRPGVQGQVLTLMVDTGAIWSLLDEGSARQLGLKTTSTSKAVQGLDRLVPRTLSATRIDEFTLGEGIARNVRMGVADLQPWFLSKREVQQARAAGQPLVELDGLLGVDHLFAFGALIDCRRRQLWVSRERMAK